MFSPNSLIFLWFFYVSIHCVVLVLNESETFLIPKILEMCASTIGISNVCYLTAIIDISNCALRAQKNDYGAEGEMLVHGWGVGGEKAVEREFPYMALIGYNDGDKILWLCGGTLISEQFVLTAAHCFEANIYGPPTNVRLGEHDLSVTDNATLDVKIIERFRHPEYNSSQKYNDIGLLGLEHKLKFNVAIQPACLPEGPNITRNRLIATGWGRDEWNIPSNILMKVTLVKFSQSECDDIYGIENAWPLGILEDTQLCAGSLKKLRNTCEGDSGGPIQIYRETRFCTYTVVGVTSFGYPCHIKGLPGVYVKIYPYLKWIESIVWPN